MAVARHLVTKTHDSGQKTIDGIRTVLIAIDDGVDTTAALIQARAVTVINATSGMSKLPTGYFDANTAVSTFDAAGDIAVVNGEVTKQVIA